MRPLPVDHFQRARLVQLKSRAVALWIGCFSSGTFGIPAARVRSSQPSFSTSVALPGIQPEQSSAKCVSHPLLRTTSATREIAVEKPYSQNFAHLVRLLRGGYANHAPAPTGQRGVEQRLGRPSRPRSRGLAGTPNTVQTRNGRKEERGRQLRLATRRSAG